MAKNTYFLTDKEIDDFGKKIVDKLYGNKDILELKNNGRTLNSNIASLVDRPISGLYSNIENNNSLKQVLTNAIRYAVLVEKNTILETEFKKIREACERRKNMLLVLERKLKTDSSYNIEEEIEKTKEEIKLLEEEMSVIATQNSEPPAIKKNILELAKDGYKLLLRGDKTSEKLYIAVCKYLNVKIDKSHFGYDVYNQNNQYNNNYDNRYNNRYNNRYDNKEEKKDIYIPPVFQSNYRRNNNYKKY